MCQSLGLKHRRLKTNSRVIRCPVFIMSDKGLIYQNLIIIIVISSSSSCLFLQQLRNHWFNCFPVTERYTLTLCRAWVSSCYVFGFHMGSEALMIVDCGVVQIVYILLCIFTSWRIDPFRFQARCHRHCDQTWLCVYFVWWYVLLWMHVCFCCVGVFH